MRSGIAIRSLLFAFVVLAFSQGAAAQIGISVGFGPPLLPIYEQPILASEGYLWAPGYWGYDYAANDYYWVPGTWVYPPQAGFCGRRVIGAGAATRTFSIKDIGARRWATTAGLITATVTAALDMRAGVGKGTASCTTLP